MGISLGVVTIIASVIAGTAVGIWQGVKKTVVHGENDCDGSGSGHNNSTDGYNNCTGGYGNYTSTNANLTAFDPGASGLGDITFGGPGGDNSHGIPDWQIGVIVACIIGLVVVTIAAAVVIDKRRKAKKIEEKSIQEKKAAENEEDKKFVEEDEKVVEEDVKAVEAVHIV